MKCSLDISNFLEEISAAAAAAAAVSLQSCSTLCDPIDGSPPRLPPSLGFSRQEYWSGLPFPSPEEISSLSHSIVVLYFFALFMRKAFLSLLAILWNSAFKWVHLSFSPLLFISLLFTAICKASSDSHFAFLHLFFLGMVLIPVSCTMS